MKNLRFLACLAVPSILAATAACGDPDCSVTKTCNVGNTTASSGGASTSTTSSAQGGAGGTGTGGMSTGSGGTGGQAAAPGDVIWERSFGDVSSDDPKRLVLQSDESVVIGGDFEGSIDFGGGNLLATSNSRDVFVARLGSDGAEVWASKYGSGGTELMTDVAIDQGDNVYLLGNFTTSVDFGLGALNSVDENDLFLVRLTSGQASWSMRIGSTFVDTAESIAASPANEVAVAASWQDALSIGTTNLSGTQQARNAVVAKVTGVNPMNATWNQVSSGAFGQSRTVKTMAADPSGNLAFVIRGTSQTGGFTISYDGASETSNNGAPLAVLFRATSSGAYSWHKRLDGQSNVTVDTFSNGDVLICGSYTGAGDFASGFTLPAASGRDVWIARFSAIGQRVWDRRYGGPGQDGQNGADVACAVTPDGGYVVAFWSDDAVDLGGTMVPSTAASVVVGEFGDDGMNLWNRRSTGDASVRSVDAGAQSVALLLSYDTSVGFDTASSTAGMNDVHVTRFSR